MKEENGGFRVLVFRSPTGYDDLWISTDGSLRLNEPKTVPQTSQGFLDWNGETPILTDNGRNDNGILLPNYAGGLVVGQHPQDPPRVVARYQGMTVTLDTVTAFEVRVVQETPTFWRVVARSANNLWWLAWVQLPLVADEDVDKAPVLDEPGVTVTRFSSTLRNGSGAAVEFVDRNNPAYGYSATVELVPTSTPNEWSWHCTFKNAKGTNRSGLIRKVIYRG